MNCVLRRHLALVNVAKDKMQMDRMKVRRQLGSGVEGCGVEMRRESGVGGVPPGWGFRLTLRTPDRSKRGSIDGVLNYEQH